MDSSAIRYLFIGTYNAGIGFLIFYLINLAVGDIFHYLVVLIISYFISLTHAYIGQRWVVFRSKAPWLKEYLRFLMVNLTGMAGNALLLFIFVEAGMGLMLAQAISVLIVTVFSYFGHRYFSFKSHE
jgi:putative flippase GtrA